LQDNPSHEAFDYLAHMFRAVERAYGEVRVEEMRRFGVCSTLRARRILNALRDRANTPRRQLETGDRKAALGLMRLHTPTNRLISRNTRAVLRRYFKEGKLSTPIADRQVEDRFIELSSDERSLYDAMEDYISSTYNQATTQERNAIGFVMTVYRRRLASSFFALSQTLETHLRAITNPDIASIQGDLEENLDGGVEGEEPDADEAAKLEHAALALEERSEIERLLTLIRRLPPDTKVERLRETIGQLRSQGYEQVMVFTQFTDTMDFLRSELGRDLNLRIMCFSGRGGEVTSPDGKWRTITRDDVKRRFREAQGDVLLCTDAASEGLNFQFCGALINYDMPWNPMRVEQRIGRIDRLGQRYPNIRVVNLHYADTVEADVYRALRQRIGLFEQVVGRLQPILARLPTLISDRVLTGRTRPSEQRREAVNEVEQEADRVGAAGFDIDAVTDTDLVEPALPPSPVTMDDLERVISNPTLAPPGLEASGLGPREYAFQQPNLLHKVRISTDPAYYEQNADTVEFWSPGNPTFPPSTIGPEPFQVRTLAELLQQSPKGVSVT
jgi:hypothetical protein